MTLQSDTTVREAWQRSMEVRNQTGEWDKSMSSHLGGVDEIARLRRIVRQDFETMRRLRQTLDAMRRDRDASDAEVRILRKMLASMTPQSDTNPITALFRLQTETYGVIKIEEWPEGLVIWVGGEIRWSSFDWPRK
jgi:hypothetical protein